MNQTLEKICSQVLREITPDKTERTRVLTLAESVREKVEHETLKAGFDATVRIEGSIAKDTWLKIDPDIDIFIQVQPETPRDIFKTEMLKIARKATKGAKHVERFAEHPYLEALFRGSTRVNIVPCYKTKLGEWKSATDRTPYHTDYVKKKLNPLLCEQVRLLKRFMKGIDVYGAEIKVGGFSGYLCELLILNYGAFVKTLEAFTNWKREVVVDYEAHYKNRRREIELLFREPLKIIDPVDPARNVASAVRKQCLETFITAARAFLKKPHRSFFFPPKTEIVGKNQIAQTLGTRGTTLAFVKFGKVDAVPDVLWGQLYRSQRSLRKMLDQHDFNVFRETVWSDESRLNVFIFELENRCLPPTRKHSGPPLEKRAECDNFLRTHFDSPNTVYGPFVDSGRWIVRVKRRHTDVVDLLRNKLKDGGRNIGVAGHVSEALIRGFEILVNEEILKDYLVKPKFARFLVDFLVGKPKWLGRQRLED